jgi:hypothetical protein
MDIVAHFSEFSPHYLKPASTEKWDNKSAPLCLAASGLKVSVYVCVHTHTHEQRFIHRYICMYVEVGPQICASLFGGFWTQGVCVCMCTHAHAQPCTHASIHIHTETCMCHSLDYLHTHTHVYMHKYIHTYIHTYRGYVYMYVYVCTYIYVYAHWLILHTGLHMRIYAYIHTHRYGGSMCYAKSRLI